MYKIKAFVPYEMGEEREPKKIKFGSLNFAETTFETERLIEFLTDLLKFNVTSMEVKLNGNFPTEGQRSGDEMEHDVILEVMLV